MSGIPEGVGILEGRDGYTRVVGIPEGGGGYTRGQVYQIGVGIAEGRGGSMYTTPLDLGYPPYTPLALTPSAGHQNTYGWQAGGTHPTGMLSC